MIKASELLPVVIQLATDNPDKTSACYYFEVDDSTPCCIVGHGLAALGVDREPFLEDDELNQYTSVRELTRVGQLRTDDEDALRALALIQSGQDGGLTWGSALARANEQTGSVA